MAAAASIVVSASCDQEPLSPPSARVEAAETGEGWARVVRVMEPKELGLSTPAGLAFSPASGLFLVGNRSPGGHLDSPTEIELITVRGHRAATVRIEAGLPEPANMAFDTRANRLLILQGTRGHLLEVPATLDGSLDIEAMRVIRVQSFGLRDPRGLTVDPASGVLYALDADGPHLVRIEPDPRRGLESPSVLRIDLALSRATSLHGLAFDPRTGNLHVLDPEGQELYEVTERGQPVAVRDLSAMGFRNPQGMTFGPTGDATDDPSEMSLYITDSGLGGDPVFGGTGSFAETGHITELSLAEPSYFAAGGAGDETAILIQTVDVSQLSPPSPDAAGITYLGNVGDLLISDSEVNEMSIYEGVNLFQLSLSGTLNETYTSEPISNEPTGITWNPNNNHIFMSDDTGTRSVYELDPGPDGVLNTSDDVATSFETSTFGSDDPEGVTFDMAQGVLFIVDGVNREVYRVAPGPNGVFDGASPDGDDDVTHWDTSRFGLDDPEGIAYDSDFGHLYIVGKPSSTVFHVTTDGTLLRTIDISAANPDKPAGLAYAPSSVNPSAMSLYVVDRGTDNNSDPKENDGMLFELSFSSSGDALPTVSITAPSDGGMFVEGESVSFAGTASDAEDGDLTADLAWTSSLDGPIGTGGAFSAGALTLGTHLITASVTDSGGQQALSTISITVNPDGVMTVEVDVTAESDDAEEDDVGAVDLNSSDLELVEEGTIQTVGMRFNGLAIPQGATITNATIQFQTDETDNGAIALTIRGEASDNAATFTTATGNWETVGEAGPDQRTPDISSVIQEVVNRPGWASGNSLAINPKRTGTPTAEPFHGTAAPKIQVVFATDSDPPPNVAPAAGFTHTTTDLTADFTDTSSDSDGSVVS
jgi:uncharacterized protein YjiK